MNPVVIGNAKLHNANCIEVMRSMPDNSVDSIVTDPPYELGFMGKTWDASGIAYSVEMWREALRVLKPGGHLLAFSGSRTYHRMACAIEDAGFDIRDQIMWVYGSGFPKSQNVSIAIDKQAGARGHAGTRFTTAGQEGDRTNGGDVLRSDHPDYIKPQPITDAARQWEGWGTALKPAHEPICVARKPLIGTVAANVLQFGTGAINIDACRVATDEVLKLGKTGLASTKFFTAGIAPEIEKHQHDAGRWPANLIHDGSDEVLAGFPDSNGSGAARTLARGNRDGEGRGMANEPGQLRDAGTGSAARFFYQAKCSKADRNSGLDGIVYVILEWNNSTTGEIKWGVEARQVKLWVDTAQYPPKVTGVFGTGSKSATEWNTMLCGSVTTGQSPKDSTCTTLTKTSLTTPSEILSFFQNCITNVSTADANCETASGGSPAENAASCSTLIATTCEWMVSALGANPAASPMQLKLSASVATSGHPTVKPTDLMAYLVRLVTPPGGLVLDPFTGSGSTGKAAVREGFRFVGCDLSPEYVAIAAGRISAEIDLIEQTKSQPMQGSLI